MKKLVPVLLAILAVVALPSFKKAAFPLPPPGSEIGTFTNWEKISFTNSKNEEVSFEYRIALVKKVAFGCHYDVQVKNNSSSKMSVSVEYSYFDNLVKSTYKNVVTMKVKKGKTGVARLIVQGCKKKDKDSKEDSKAAICLGCGLEYSVTATQ